MSVAPVEPPPLRGRFALSLALAFAAIVVVAIGAALLSAVYRLRQHDLETVDRELLDKALLLEELALRELPQGAAGERSLEALVRRLGTDTASRFTVVALDGRVLADSHEDPARMGRHDQRPEVRRALASGEGVESRHSDTLHDDLRYYARRVDREGKPLFVVRVAYTLAAIDTRVGVVTSTVLVATAIAVLLGVGMGVVAARRLSRPIAEMAATACAFAARDFGRRAGAYGGELGDLARDLNAMGAELERALAASESERRLLALVLSGMGEGVLAVDGSERVVLLNEAARGLVAPTAATGAELASLSRDPALLDLVARARRGERRSVELALPPREPAAPPRLLRASAAPLALGASGTGALVVLADLAEVRRLETIRRDFVANVSHELKTPLTSIVGYADTLLEGALEDRENARRFVEKIAGQGSRLARLVEDLLALARLEREEEPSELAPVPLAAAIAAAVERFAEKAKARRVELRSEVAPDAAEARALGGEELLREALDNLIDNAVKYAPEGGHVSVRARSEAALLSVVVEDDGPGIPEDSLPRIFERFHRVDKARSRALGGTGLGLAIVKHAARSMGGSVSVESEVGRGSRFRLELRRA